MSNYLAWAINPKTGEKQRVTMLDDFYGPHRYAARFPDGATYPEQYVTIVHEEEEDE